MQHGPYRKALEIPGGAAFELLIALLFTVERFQ
jgi:hypothetical protein